MLAILAEKGSRLVPSRYVFENKSDSVFALLELLDCWPSGSRFMRESILSSEASVLDNPLFSHAINVGFVSRILGLASHLRGPEEGGPAGASVLARVALGIRAGDLAVCLIVAELFDWFEREISNNWTSLSARANFTVLSLARSAVKSTVRRWLSLRVASSCSFVLEKWFLNLAIIESLSCARNYSRSQSKAALKLNAKSSSSSLDCLACD
jgi:hypothetical protein